MAKADDLPALSETQMEIMSVVWERGEATLGDVWKALSGQRDVARNTIQTLLTRLVDKGWLKYRAEGKIFHYRATVARESSLKAVARRMVSTAFRGSTEGLMMALFDGQKLSPEEAERIREIIDRAAEREDSK